MGVTRKDVARLAGVSTATVSYVINSGPRPVADETRKRVVWAIKQLNYQPSAIARSLTTKRTNTIGFIIPDILNPVHSSIAKSFEDALRSAGYSLILCNSDEDPEVELAYLHVLISKQVDGIALTPTGENRSLIFSIIEQGKTVLLLDRLMDGAKADCVLFDNEPGTYFAIRHLIEQGHQRIGLIGLQDTLTPGKERLDGYKRALLEGGIKIDPDLIRMGTFKAQEGEALIESLLSIENPPTAIFVGSNRLMRSLLPYVKSHHLRLPDDIAICTFDDLSDYATRTPSITAVSTSTGEFGTQAAQLLIARMTGAYVGEPRQIRIPCTLNIRESSTSTNTPSPKFSVPNSERG
jgi:LacI family transcriptional regulator